MSAKRKHATTAAMRRDAERRLAATEAALAEHGPLTEADVAEARAVAAAFDAVDARASANRSAHDDLHARMAAANAARALDQLPALMAEFEALQDRTDALKAEGRPLAAKLNTYAARARRHEQEGLLA